MSGTRFGAGLLVIIAWSSTLGCSGSGRPTTAPVRGRVTYEGKPVSGASVAFLCPGAPRLAFGTTDEVGNYRLTTYEENDGAIIGTHVVTVKKEMPETESSVNTDQPIDPKLMSKSIEQAMRQTAQNIEKAEKAKPLLPPKYAERRTSDLRKDVVQGDNVIDIELVN